MTTRQISDEWVPVTEDTPPIGKGYKNVSRDVALLTEGGQRSKATMIIAATGGGTQVTG